MSVAELWTKFLRSDAAWPKVVAAVTAGAVGVWSWATNKPDPETGKKSMIKSGVTVGALFVGTALGITKLTRTSIRQAIQTFQEGGGMQGGINLGSQGNSKSL